MKLRGRCEGYPEIEFVCVNPNFPEATPPAKQRRLFRSLRKVPGILVYRQQDEGADDISMSVVLMDPAAATPVRALAKQHGVAIDVEGCVSTKTVDEVVSGQRGVPVLDWYMTGRAR